MIKQIRLHLTLNWDQYVCQGPAYKIWYDMVMHANYTLCMYNTEFSQSNVLMNEIQRQLNAKS
jgi:hypothetical protein